MKRTIGLVLIISAVTLIVLILYSKPVAGESDLTWFSLIVPALFLFQGLTYLRPPIQIQSYVSNEVASQTGEHAFDPSKRNALVTKLRAMQGEPLVSIQEFFDGNLNDLGSIGCNLYPTHPGIEVFKSAFQSLLDRNDVSEIYAHISEIEPDEESWPYTDRVYVFGSISPESLAQLTKEIRPTEVGEPSSFFSKMPIQIKALNPNPVKVLWWD